MPLRFGVTYEGLKPGTPTLRVDHGHRFGVTYEGLKLKKIKVNTVNYKFVLELPMRV